MDRLAKLNMVYEIEQYKNCGIDVDALSEDTAKKMLKLTLGMVKARGQMSIITACQECLDDYIHTR